MSRLFAKVLCPMLLLAAFVGVVVAPGHAEAKLKIPIPYNMGPYYYPAVTLELPPGSQQKELDVLWKCDHGFELFWFNVAKFGCNIVVLKQGYPRDADALDQVEDQYRAEIPAEVLKKIETKHPFSTVERSFWNKYGRWFLLVALIGLGIFYLRSSKTEEAKDAATPAGDKPSTDASGSTAPQNG